MPAGPWNAAGCDLSQAPLHLPDLLTLSMAPLVVLLFSWITVCSRYRRPRDCSVRRWVSLVPAKLRLSVMYSFRTGSPLMSKTSHLQHQGPLQACSSDLSGFQIALCPAGCRL